MSCSRSDFAQLVPEAGTAGVLPAEGIEGSGNPSIPSAAGLSGCYQREYKGSGNPYIPSVVTMVLQTPQQGEEMARVVCGP